MGERCSFLYLRIYPFRRKVKVEFSIREPSVVRPTRTSVFDVLYKQLKLFNHLRRTPDSTLTLWGPPDVRIRQGVWRRPKWGSLGCPNKTTSRFVPTKLSPSPFVAKTLYDHVRSIFPVKVTGDQTRIELPTFFDFLWTLPVSGNCVQVIFWL